MHAVVALERSHLPIDLDGINVVSNFFMTIEKVAVHLEFTVDYTVYRIDEIPTSPHLLIDADELRHFVNKKLKDLLGRWFKGATVVQKKIEHITTEYKPVQRD